MHLTNPDSLRSCLCFRVFRLNFTSDFFNLLLVRFHQAEIIVVKHLIQGRNNEAWVGDEPSTLRSGSRTEHEPEFYKPVLRYLCGTEPEPYFSKSQRANRN